MIKKNIIIQARSPFLSQRQGDCPHSVGVSQSATLLILAQLHLRLAPHFLKFFGPPVPNFFIIHPRKKKSKSKSRRI